MHNYRLLLAVDRVLGFQVSQGEIQEDYTDEEQETKQFIADNFNWINEVCHDHLVVNSIRFGETVMSKVTRQSITHNFFQLTRLSQNLLPPHDEKSAEQAEACIKTMLQYIAYAAYKHFIDHYTEHTDPIDSCSLNVLTALHSLNRTNDQHKKVHSDMTNLFQELLVNEEVKSNGILICPEESEGHALTEIFDFARRTLVTRKLRSLLETGLDEFINQHFDWIYSVRPNKFMIPRGIYDTGQIVSQVTRKQIMKNYFQLNNCNTDGLPKHENRTGEDADKYIQHMLHYIALNAYDKFVFSDNTRHYVDRYVPSEDDTSKHTPQTILPALKQAITYTQEQDPVNIQMVRLFKELFASLLVDAHGYHDPSNKEISKLIFNRAGEILTNNQR